MTELPWRSPGRPIVRLLIAVALTSAVPAAFGVTIGAPLLIGSNSSMLLDEISGLVDSRTNANTFWVHNDSGDPARFFAMSYAGALLGTFSLDGAPLGDWEDIAMGPKAGGGNYLYLGDIGDNDAERTFVTVYRTAEPQSTADATIPAESYTAVHLQYPGGPRDAESMFIDPVDNELYVITKRTSPLQIYSAPTSVFENPGQTVMLTARGTVGGPFRWATGADISSDGRFVLVRSSLFPNGYLFERGAGQSAADALHGDGIPFTLGTESQGEAIGWAADGKSFFTTSELDGFPSAPIYSYAFTAPALLPGDYNNDHRVDAADYTVWRNQMGAQVALPNEIETLGVVTAEDYDVWRAHFGESSDGGAAIAPSAGAAVVPEPATLMLVVMAACAVGLVARHGT